MAPNITTIKPTAASSNWRSGLPVLTGLSFTLRELRLEDAPSLMAMLTSEDVARFISPPPSTIENLKGFIAWTHREREAGNNAGFAVVPAGMTDAVGIFLVRSLESGFATGEWGFALGSQYWGTGVFEDAASLVLDFAFNVIGANRLEARACAANGRGNGALRKIGAVQEGILRRSFVRRGEYQDQVLWGILADDWRLRRLAQQPVVTH
ncbi:MAG: GNAT family protein [Vicinamibacterales bacterium]